MYSVLVLAMAAAAAGVLGWSALAWLRLRGNLVLFNVAALGAVVLALGLAGAGRWIGAGAQLRDLHALPALVAAVAWPLSLFTFATLARRLGHRWARIDWGHGAVCLGASALLAWSLYGLGSLKAMAPACWRDVLWYLPAVPRPWACGPESIGGSAPPIVLAAVLAAYLALVVGLWRRQGEPGLAALMAAGIALQLLPAAVGPLPGFLGLALCFGGIARVAVRHAALFARPPADQPPASGS
jgi:hypothetical protein